jgi:pseudouridine kinase
MLFANVAQAAAIAGVERFAHPRHAANPLRELGARSGIVTGGSMGIAVWWGDELKAFPALDTQPRDVTGAGDALAAGTLFGLSQWNDLPDAAQFGLAAAAITVESEHTRAPELSLEWLHRRMIQHGRP